MFPRTVSVRGQFARATILSLMFWAAARTGLAQGQPPAQPASREQQIKDFERQLDELKKKLDELKAPAKAPAPKPSTELRLAPEWVKAMRWRSIGPANMGGRIVAITVLESDPCTWWVATAGGGLLKTMNNGITFEHQFDKEATVAIGDVCVAPSDGKIVWLGTGENNPRNSVSFGDGVYKSTDGGKTWKNMGLKETFQIGRIIVHPKNPDVVYVGALGRLYGPNPDRGLFKTTDGGKTWTKVLFVDDKTGIIDMRMHPSDPETLLVATYERERDLYDTNDPSKKWGPGGGLYKTTDGGKTFKKLKQGLPTAQLGRIGLDWYRKDPNVVFAIIESEKIGMGPPGAKPAGNGYLGLAGRTEEEKTEIVLVAPDSPGAKAGLKVGDSLLAVGDQPVRDYMDFMMAMQELSAGDKIKLKVGRGPETLTVELTAAERPAGGRGPGGGGGFGGGGGRGGADATHPFGAALGGQRENVQNRQTPDGHLYGGVYRSADAGETWTRINSLNPRPMYFSQVRVDPTDEKYLYVLGVSLYRSSNGGKTFRSDGGRSVHADHHALYIDPRDGRHMLLGGDGGIYVTCDRMERWDHLNHAAIGQFYHVAIDTTRDYKVYGGLQDNGSWGGPSRTHNGSGPINEDWVSVGGGDGFKCQVDPNDPDQIYYTSQNGAMGAGTSAPANPPRFARKTEAPRNARGRMLRLAVLRRGAPGRGQSRYRFNWNTPFILSHHNSRIFYAAGNVVFRSLDRGNDLRAISPNITRTDKGSASALAESPRNPNIVYVGTDDGALWMTKDGGATWTDIVKNVGLPKPCYVATIEASRYAEGRAYVAFDGHRSDIDDPLVYVTEDLGKTWKPLRANLPRGSSRCLREDHKNDDLLYLGTEFGFWVSLDRGESWNSLNSNLPTVAVLDVAIHPTAGELVAATHGRSLWVLDVSPLRQTTREVAKAGVHLYKPTSAVRWRSAASHGGTNRRFEGQNPSTGAVIDYALGKKAAKLSLKILDVNGATVSQLPAVGEPGLHRVVWNLTRGSAQGAGQGFRGGLGGAQARAGGAGGQAAAAAATGTGPRPTGAPAATGGPARATTPVRPPARASRPRRFRSRASAGFRRFLPDRTASSSPSTARTSPRPSASSPTRPRPTSNSLPTMTRRRMRTRRWWMKRVRRRKRTARSFTELGLESPDPLIPERESRSRNHRFLVQFTPISPENSRLLAGHHRDLPRRGQTNQPGATPREPKHPQKSSPERALQRTPLARRVSPFQGSARRSMAPRSWGVAPGWFVWPLRGRNPTRTARVRWCLARSLVNPSEMGVLLRPAVDRRGTGRKPGVTDDHDHPSAADGDSKPPGAPRGIRFSARRRFPDRVPRSGLAHLHSTLRIAR